MHRLLPLVLLAVLLLPGCRTAAPIEAPQGNLDIRFLIQRHNRATLAVKQLRARHVLEARWVDAEGKKQFEQGDGLLIVRPPAELALTVGKLGDTWHWIGCNVEQFWWLDINPHDENPDTAWLGTQADGMWVRFDTGMDLPARPDQLVHLLGLTLLPDAAKLDALETVDGNQRAAWVRVAGNLDAGRPHRRLLLDERTARVLAVEMIGRGEQVLVTSKLARHEPLPTTGLPPGAWPEVPTRMELTAPGRDAKAVLFISAMSDKKISDNQFDFDRLVTAYRLEDRIRRIRDAGSAEATPAP